MQRITGLIAAPFTPLDKNGNLALEQVRPIAQLYAQNGVSGAFICGSTGEGASLSFGEKSALMTAWGKEKRADLKAVFMLGGTCLPEMQELARAAAGEGMDGISILCPYYFRPDSVATLVEYCSAVARVSPQLPFYYYHIPALTHGHFSMLEFLRLAEERIPNLAGIKYTAPNIMDFHACRLYGAEKYDLLWGTDEALLSGWAVGARGAVGSTYNYAAPLYHRIIAAFQAGDMAEAERLQQQAVRLVQLLVKYGGIGAGKAFMKLIGIDCGWFRPPISHPGPAEVKALRSELETIGFFDFCSQL